MLQGWTFTHGSHAGDTRDLVVIATSDSRVIAYDLAGLTAAGAVAPLWTRTLPHAPSSRGGSNIPPPIGITSTPVLDPANGRMFVMSLTDASTSGTAYRIVSLDLDTGSVLEDVELQDTGAGPPPGRPTFDASLQDQRGGLNLVGDRVVATFAAFLAYDEGLFRGWVVSCHANNLSNQWFFPTVVSMAGGGVWGPGGAAADPVDGTLYVATGNATFADAAADTAYWNGFASGGAHAGQHPGDINDFPCAVVRLGTSGSSWSGHFQLLDWYMSTATQQTSDADQDLGSSSPILLPTINGRDLLVVAGKDACVYLLDRAHLGHWGNELQRLPVFSAEAKCAPAYLKTAAGDHHVFVMASGDPGLVCFRVDAGGWGATLTEVWRAGDSGGTVALGDAPGSPVVGEHPGASGTGLVWIVDWVDGASGALIAFDSDSGAEVFNSTNSPGDDLGEVPHFAPITCVGNAVLVGTHSGFGVYTRRHWKFRKELKPEIDVLKLEIEIPKLKDAEGPWQEFPPEGDPTWELVRVLAERVDALEEHVAEGRAFIREEERPDVGAEERRSEQE